MHCLTLPTLTLKALQALIDDKVLAIKIPEFFPLDMCVKLAQWYEHHPERTNYSYVVNDNGKNVAYNYGVARVGVSFNTTFGKTRDDPTVKQYYELAQEAMCKTREVCFPHVPPMDKLRLLLDELYGAEIARFEGKMMFVGIGRVTLPNATLLEKKPHCDYLPFEGVLDKQFSANVYLTVPDEGGELEIWERAPLNPQEIDEMDKKENVRSTLGNSLLIKPEQGDLILINPARPHAVRTFREGSRVSTTCFIGYKKGKSLQLWS